MNFEMAQEMAQMEDIKVERVIVNDDIAVSDVEKRRGVAGTVFVHKYAGYLADQGLSLEDIKTKLNRLFLKLKVLGWRLLHQWCQQLGNIVSILMIMKWKLVSEFMVKGLHREAIQSVDVIIERLLDELLKEVKDRSLIVMVNGMGGTPLSELSIVAKYLNQQFQEHDIAAKQWFVGDYMTSLDMQGFSITVVPYSEEIEKGLLAPTTSRYF